MNISQEEAQDSLNQIEVVSSRMRRNIVASYASPLLILWGLVWIAAFVGTHFFLAWAWYIWMSLDIIGVAGTFLICRHQYRSATPTKISAAKKIGWRIFWFWALLGIYIFIWLSILHPVSGLQTNAFLCTVIMFAYIAIGLWFESFFMIWLALAVTAITLLGLYLIPHSFYCLWMALAGGGAMLGTGLYARIRWRQL